MFSYAVFALQYRRAVVAAVEDQIDGRQKRHEGLVLLRIDRMPVVLPNDLDAPLLERADIEVVARRAAAQIPLRAEMGAQVHQALRLRAADADRRREDDIRRQF